MQTNNLDPEVTLSGNYDLNDLIIYTDGGARGNPGPAGIGAVFQNLQFETIATIKKYIGEQTNNFAEYTALITALEQAQKFGFKNISCYLDSQLVVRQLNGQYKIKEQTLKPLAQKVFDLKNEFDSIKFTHVPREKNSQADKLVNEAIDEHQKQAR